MCAAICAACTSGISATGTAHTERAGAQGEHVGSSRGKSDHPSAERCVITSAAGATRYFGAQQVSETTGTTGIGNPFYRFTLRTSDLEVPRAITASLAAGTSTTAFAKAEAAARGAASVTGLADRAFYTARTGTLQLLKNGKRVIVQAALHVSGGSTLAPRMLRRDLVLLGRSIAEAL